MTIAIIDYGMGNVRSLMNAFEYIGEDQSDYTDQVTPINSEDDGTLQPIIDLLRWVR